MKKKISQGEDTVYLPRSEKHFHIIVSDEMHYALRQYAAKHNFSMASAAARYNTPQKLDRGIRWI